MATIREDTTSDIPGLIGLYHQLSMMYRGDPSAIRAALSHPTTCVYVAVERGRVIGTATISFHVVPSVGTVAYVDDVVVDEKARGKGVGAKLMRTLERYARWRGCASIDLTSRPARAEANRLYARFGYRKRKTNIFRLDLGEGR